MSILRITADSTASEIAEALGHLSHKAAREVGVVGSAKYPTPWDHRHEAIDRLLVDYQRAVAARIEA